jgi:Zn-dependent protease with chaperone function/uncharacterized RDD family membrane protein YckC
MTGPERTFGHPRGVAGTPGAATEPALFSGPRSIRVRGERRALILCLVSAPLTIALVGLLFKAVTIQDMVLLVVAGMAFVSLSRGRLLGSSIHVHGRQFPELHAMVESVAQQLGVAPPQVFVRDELFVPIVAVGLGEPYSLMISSQYLEHLKPGELRFLVARELAHIAAGHTRLTSLLSASGRENFAIGLIFGSWLRRTEYTADRAGLLCCESLADAIGAVSLTTFHTIGRRVDIAVLNEQGYDLQTDPTLRLGEWIAGMPYATNRIAALEAFANSEQSAFWRGALALPRPALPVTVEIVEPGTSVRKRDVAPNWRRAFALVIDLTLIVMIFNIAVGATASSDVEVKQKVTEQLPGWAATLMHMHPHLTLSAAWETASLFYFIYASILVALSGQTLGMLIADVRVVTTHFAPVGVGRIIWRYLVASAMLSLVIPVLISLAMRIQFHDRLSGTRLVRSRAVPSGGRDRLPRRVEETE